MRCEKCGAYTVLPQSGICLNCIVKNMPKVKKAKKRAENHRRKQIKYGISNSDWVDIPAGAFMMGSPESEEGRDDDERQHYVEIAAFRMLKTPVTFAMYDAYCDATGKDKPKYYYREDIANHPVTHVNYWDAVNYCRWLTKEMGWHVRLPTEAEWEYACRAGTTTPFWTGETISTDQANYNFRDIPAGETTPVDMFPPNPWGLYDMHGNVWEWCASEYDKDYGGMELHDASRDRSNNSPRVARGGLYIKVAGKCRSASRFGLMLPRFGLSTIGFRLARD